MRWVTLTTNLVGVLELLAVFFLVFKNRFNENGANLLTGSRVVPAMTAVLIALLVIAAILSVASVIVSYAVHSEEDAEGDAYWDDDDENRNAPTGLIDDNDTAPVTGSIPVCLDCSCYSDPDEHEQELCNYEQYGVGHW